MWQATVSVKCGQRLPLVLGASTIVRLRSAVPPPHSALHADHCPHSLVSQWTGQSWSVQSRVSVSAGQSLPPCALACIILRRRSWLPPPHVAEHEAQSLQVDTTQCTAAGAVGAAVGTAVGAAVAIKLAVRMYRAGLCEVTHAIFCPNVWLTDSDGDM